MTTSPQPWSFRLMGGNSQRAEVLDASGKTIAHFLDARDAELVCDTSQEIAALQSENAKLTDQIAELKAKY